MLVQATYPGADAETLVQSVATPIEQQMSGVDNSNYFYSTNANNGLTQITVDFKVGTNPDIDQVLTQLRTSQAQSQLPAIVNTAGLTVTKSLTSPLMLVALVLPARHIRQHFSGELRLHQPGGRTHPRAGHFARAGFRRRPICHAHLGEARPVGQAAGNRAPDSGGCCKLRTPSIRPDKSAPNRFRTASNSPTLCARKAASCLLRSLATFSSARIRMVQLCA